MVPERRRAVGFQHLREFRGYADKFAECLALDLSAER